MQTIEFPPGPRDSAVENLYAMRRDPIGFFTRLSREYGDICHFNIGPQNLYLINHPDMIKEVLITRDREFTRWYAVDRIKEVLGNGLFVSEGEFYTRQRRLSQPAFHRERISGYAATMVKIAVRVRERWQAGEIVDVAEEMNWLAMVIVADTLFGADVESEADEVRDALSEVLKHFEKSTIPSADTPDYDAARARLDATIYRIIHERRASGEDRGDLLSMLLLARDEDDGSGMTDLQVRDEAMSIFLAGHESTANALTWSWYQLSQNPDVEAKLHAELDAVLGGRLPGMEDFGRLAYTTKVFAETIRLYPPLWSIARRAMNEMTIGNYTLPKDAIVILSQYVTHHDPRYFPDPERFDPERWTEEAKAARPKYCYYPFSAGSKQCIGESFAWMEAVIAISVIGRKWRLSLVPGHRVEMWPQLTLRCKYGMRMRVEPR